MADLTPEEIESLSRAMGNSLLEIPTKNNENKPSDRSNLEEQSRVAISRAQFRQLENAPLEEQETTPIQDITYLHDLELEIEVVFGKTKATLEEILKFKPGSILALDKLAGESVDLVVNHKVIAKAEILVIGDNYGIRILEILK